MEFIQTLIMILIILLALGYVAFGFYTYYFAANTNKESIKNASIITKVTYYHGLIFIVLFMLSGIASILSAIIYSYR